MKILYVGQLQFGGTCLDRMRALERLGHELVGFNTSEFESRNQLLRSLQWRAKPGILLRRLNNEIVRVAGTVPECDMVWIDKGVWVYPETIRRLRTNRHARIVHFSPDPHILYNRSRHFINGIPLYDAVVTTKSFEIALYEEAGARHVILSQQGFCPIRYRKLQQDKRYAVDVGFIGHYEKHYESQVQSLVGGFYLGVWGSNWKKKTRFSSDVYKTVLGDGVYGGNYVSALATFKIGLGLLTKYIPEQHTTRSFEIPAAGCFLLAERTEEHLNFFNEGTEAEFFSSTEELIDKAEFYLTNERARTIIAEAGWKRCWQSGYDNDSVLKDVLDRIE